MSKETYIPGDHWVIDDRTGLKIRASEAKREWNGLLVHKDTWEPRHPQDLVRARADRQVAEPTRPRPVDTFIGPLTTDVVALDGAFSMDAFSQAFSAGPQPHPPGRTSIGVVSSSGMEVGHRVSIMLDNDDTFRAVITGVPDSTTIEFTPALPYWVSGGNRVFNNIAMTEADTA